MAGAVGGLVGAVRRTGAEVPVPVREEKPVPPEVTGFAELVVGRWVSVDSPDDLNELFADTIEVPGRGTRSHVLGFASTVAAREVGSGYWAVTVAVEVGSRDEATWTSWFVEVGIRQSNGGLVAVGSPAIVPPPPGAPARPAGPPLRTPSPDDPLVATAQGFFSALLTGDGAVDRYVAPRFVLPPIEPAPFAGARLRRASTAAANGSVRMRAEVEAVTTGGSAWLLGYELELVERAGRWEVRSVSGAPTLATDAAPPPSSSTTQPEPAASSPAPTTSTTADTTPTPGA